MLTGEGVGAAWPLLVTTDDNRVITANCVLVETGIREGSDMTEDFEKTSIRYSPPQVMTVDEVAIYLGFTEATIRRMLRDREMPAAKVAGQWRFLKTEVDRWLADLSKQLVDPREAEDRAHIRSLHGPEARQVSREALLGLANMVATGEVDKDEALSLLAGLPDVSAPADRTGE